MRCQALVILLATMTLVGCDSSSGRSTGPAPAGGIVEKPTFAPLPSNQMTDEQLLDSVMAWQACDKSGTVQSTSNNVMQQEQHSELPRRRRYTKDSIVVIEYLTDAGRDESMVFSFKPDTRTVTGENEKAREVIDTMQRACA